jgi:hypothetical protein
MSSIKKRKKKKLVEPPKVSMYDTVPEDIKMLFGKFYAYSSLYILFFGILYPFFLMYYLNKIFTIVLFIMLIGLYGIIIYDVTKKKDKYKSNMFVIFIILVMFAISFSIVRFIV